MTILGENLKKIRTTAGFSISDLSNASGVGRSTISEIESGKAKNPKYATLVKLASSLNITVETLGQMEIEHEYMITDVEEAMCLILEQENLMLNGEVLTAEAKLQLANSIKMALEFTKNIQSKTKNK